jgi:signal transduction histidine kinase
VGAISRDNDVLFSVADTGCGIPPEGLSHVFDRLGAGLGLAITKGQLNVPVRTLKA